MELAASLRARRRLVPWLAWTVAVVALHAWGCGNGAMDADTEATRHARALALLVSTDGGDAAASDDGGSPATDAATDASLPADAATGGACTSDTTCNSSDFCAVNGTCQPRLGTGAVCATTAGGDCRTPGCRECASNYCDNGVCCGSSSCPGCESCAAILQQPFADGGTPGNGVCAPVIANTDPYSFCPAPSNPDACQGNGLCNGTGSCQTVSPPGTVCGQPACSGVFVSTPTCNATGTCGASSKSCAPYTCSNGTCGTTCATSSDCAPPAQCNLGTCGSAAANGTTCDTNADCSSGVCADGVCCNQACPGQCEACDVTGNIGTCAPVTGAPHESHTPCAGSEDGGTSCTGVCDGTNVNACAYPSATTACGGTCTGSTFTAGVCKGDGTCGSPVSAPCQEHFTCQSGGLACATSCQANSGCVAGYACSAGECISAVAVCVGSNLTTSLDGEDSGVFACAPYACVQDAGACATTCTTSSDCASPYVCNGGVCGTASGGGGCSVGASGGSTDAAWLLLGLGAIALAKRKRASRPAA